MKVKELDGPHAKIDVDKRGKLLTIDFTSIPDASYAVSFFPMTAKTGLELAGVLIGENNNELLFATAIYALVKTGQFDYEKLQKEVAELYKVGDTNEAN